MAAACCGSHCCMDAGLRFCLLFLELFLDALARKLEVLLVEALGTQGVTLDQRMDDLLVFTQRFLKPLMHGKREHAELLVHRANAVIGRADDAVVSERDDLVVQLLVCAGVLFKVARPEGGFHPVRSSSCWMCAEVRLARLLRMA